MVYSESSEHCVNALKTSLYCSAAKNRNFQVSPCPSGDLSSLPLNRERIGRALIAVVWLRDGNATAKRSHTNVFTLKVPRENPIYIRQPSSELGREKSTMKLLSRGA